MGGGGGAGQGGGADGGSFNFQDPMEMFKQFFSGMGGDGGVCICRACMVSAARIVLLLSFHVTSSLCRRTCPHVHARAHSPSPSPSVMTRAHKQHLDHARVLDDR